MTDKYFNFDELSSGEPGEAFYISMRDTQSATAIVAPHGGKIEPGTSEIAKAIAGDEFSLYCFEGCKQTGNRDLHITSTNFDEPRAMNLLSSCANVVAIHGCRGDDNKIYLGGLDEKLQDVIGEALQAAGFSTGIHASPNLQGKNLQNICNRGTRGCGVQLEISRNLRDELRVSNGATRLQALGIAIRSGIFQLAD